MIGGEINTQTISKINLKTLELIQQKKPLAILF
jgi:hypothetical protein